MELVETDAVKAKKIQALLEEDLGALKEVFEDF